MSTQAELRRSVHRQRYATYLMNEYVKKEIQRFARALPGLIDGDISDMTIAERKRLISHVRKDFTEGWNAMWADLTKDLDQFALAESDFVYNVYDLVKEPTEAAIIAAVTNGLMTLSRGDAVESGVWADFTKRNTDSTFRLINGVIASGWQEGRTNQEIIRDIRGGYNRITKVYQGGIINGLAKNRAEALVRTGAAHFSAVARDKTILANSDIIKKRYFLATFDNRTTLICRSLSGKTWDIDDNTYPRLPLHWNERSQYVYLFEGETEPPGTKPAVGGKAKTGYDDRPRYRGRKDSDLYDVGPIDADTSMDEWLRSQPREFIESALGTERAKLFIDGRLPIDKFTDLQGNPLTLDELAQTAQGEKAYRRLRGNDG